MRLLIPDIFLEDLAVTLLLATVSLLLVSAFAVNEAHESAPVRVALLIAHPISPLSAIGVALLASLQAGGRRGG